MQLIGALTLKIVIATPTTGTALKEESSHLKKVPVRFVTDILNAQKTPNFADFSCLNEALIGVVVGNFLGKRFAKSRRPPPLV
jgi:hypothetical protein